MKKTSFSATEAGHKFIELYAEPIVTNTYLKVALLVLAAVALAVILEDTRQEPYRAQVQFEKIFRSPGEGQVQRRERWTANVIYSFRSEVPNPMLLTNPLGLIISYVHADQAFGS